jgi:hypothetical protein
MKVGPLVIKEAVQRGSQTWLGQSKGRADLGLQLFACLCPLLDNLPIAVMILLLPGLAAALAVVGMAKA